MDNERREPERVAIQRISVNIDFELTVVEHIGKKNY